MKTNAQLLRPMMKRLLPAAILIVLGCAAMMSRAALLVYEPFNYPVGPLPGQNGGKGFSGEWMANAADNSDGGYIYDETTTNVSLGGETGATGLTWDGKINNLPTAPVAGARYQGAKTNSTSNVNIYRTLASSAGAMAAGNGGVLWMSAVYHWANRGSLGSGINIGLGSGYFYDRGRFFNPPVSAFMGVNGNSGQSVNTWNYRLNAMATTGGWQAGQFAFTLGTNALPAVTNDLVVVMKFTFGASDIVEGCVFAENETLSEAAFYASTNRVSATNVIDENQLTVLTICQGRLANAQDEIRIGTSFNDVISLPPAGPVDSAFSSVKASPASLVADGSSTSTITVVLADTLGVPVAGKNVTLANTAGPQAAVITPAGAQTTDSGGKVIFTVKSTTPGTEVFSATDTTDSLVIAQTASVTFVSKPDAVQSTVVASPSGVIADGVLTTTITVTLKDAAGFAVPGKSVTLTNTAGPKQAVISPAGPQTTDSNGQASFTVKSTTAGTEVFTAKDNSDSVVIAQTASVNFVAPNSPLAFNVNYYKFTPLPIGSPEDPTLLNGPAGGTNETWNQFAAVSGGNLLTTNGVKTAIGFTCTATEGRSWGNPDLRLLQSALTHFAKGQDMTLTITNLTPGAYYNVWLASHANNDAIAERASGIWSTSNTVGTVGGQSIDSLSSSLNGNTWEKGNNYVLFEYVKADDQGKMVFLGDATDANELTGDTNAYRLPLNGWQLRQVMPSTLTVKPTMGHPGNYNFTWNSKEGKLYDLVSAADLMLPLSAWTAWNGLTNIASTLPSNTLTNIPGGSDAHRYFAIREKNVPPVPPLLSADFETSDGGFTAVGAPNDWAWGAPNSADGFGFVLTSGHFSAKCWGTGLGDGSVPSGVITPGADSVLQSPAIDFTRVTSAKLTFAAAVDAKAGDTIKIIIKESSTGAVLGTLTPIAPPKAVSWASYGPLDVSVAAGKTAYLQFQYVGSDNTYCGLYIDNVVVTGN
jgi:hypothetical protein